MKFAAVTYLCLLRGAASFAADHPIVKVINMLEGLKAKSIAEGKEEAVAFTKFQYWCTTSTDTLKDPLCLMTPLEERDNPRPFHEGSQRFM